MSRIAKSIDVSISSDTSDIIKVLCGNFVVRVLQSCVQQHYDIVTSVELESIIEKMLNCNVEEMPRAEINVTTFAKWLKPLMDQYHLTLKKEAVLYFHNALEYFVATLFYKAEDLAKYARRKRVITQDVERVYKDMSKE